MKYIITLAALLCTSALAAQTPTELRSWLPQAEGWTISDKVEVFSPDNLFDRINGAAPLFLENNFREMTAMEYTRGDDYITVQAYRHATPEDAFGMYASERSSSLRFFPFAVEAQGDATNLYFVNGSIYVKMWGSSQSDISATLLAIGEGLSGKISPEAAYPPLFGAFPTEGRIPHSEGYVTSSYLGHTFLRSVYKVDYEREGKKFQAFVIDAATVEGAKEMLDKYFAFTGQTLEYEEGSVPMGMKLLIKDRYNGDIPVRWGGKYIVGVFSDSGAPEYADKFNEELSQNIILNILKEVIKNRE